MGGVIAPPPNADVVTYSCPIEGCDWKLHVPSVPTAPPNPFVIGLAALEVLSHVIGRYGENGRTPHDSAEVTALGIDGLRAAAFPEAR